MQTENGLTGRLHTERIFQLTRAVAEAGDIHEVFDAALTCLGTSLGTPRSAILLFDESGVMRFRAWRNLSEGYRAAVDGHSPWSRGDVPAPVIVEDVATDASLDSLRTVIEAEGIRSLGFIPLVADSRLIGKFMVYFGEAHVFTEAEVMMAETIAAQVAFAIERQLARKTNEELTIINSSFFDAVGVACYAVDPHGYIRYYNRAAAELWGREPVIGIDRWCGTKRVFDIDGMPIEMDDTPISRAIHERRPIREIEVQIERHDGQRISVVPYPTPLFDGFGNLIGAVNVLVDVTPQARMRSDLKDAILAKDDFLGQVSHELRTPLTELIGNSHLLTRRWDELSEDLRRESLESVAAQSQRMQRVVNNMLVLSRLDRGLLPETEPHLIQRLLDETITEFAARFPRARIEIEIDRELPPVETNASTVDQVFWNLLTNAVKYGPPEGPVTVKAWLDGSAVAVAVRDEGTGMAPDDLERLFEPYFRAPSTAASASGLGLGLSVCRRLLEAQGGRIEAFGHNNPSGMEFRFYLPALLD